MSATVPLSSGLPPPSWSDTTPGVASRGSSPAAGGIDWFSPSASARSLSVNLDDAFHGDVEAWVHALVNHLIEPADIPR